jgi:hypothetical protein
MKECFGGIKDQDHCTWTRRFSVECGYRPTTGTVTIAVSTNSLPDHCFYVDNVFPVDNIITFEVAFNLSPTILKSLSVSS